MKIALAQLNYIIGDFEHNTQKIIECTRVGQISLALLGSDTVATPDAGVAGTELFKN